MHSVTLSLGSQSGPHAPPSATLYVACPLPSPPLSVSSGHASLHAQPSIPRHSTHATPIMPFSQSTTVAAIAIAGQAPQRVTGRRRLTFLSCGVASSSNHSPSHFPRPQLISTVFRSSYLHHLHAWRDSNPAIATSSPPALVLANLQVLSAFQLRQSSPCHLDPSLR